MGEKLMPNVFYCCLANEHNVLAEYTLNVYKSKFD